MKPRIFKKYKAMANPPISYVVESLAHPGVRDKTEEFSYEEFNRAVKNKLIDKSLYELNDMAFLFMEAYTEKIVQLNRLKTMGMDAALNTLREDIKKEYGFKDHREMIHEMCRVDLTKE
jgi:hypothetical protein